MNLPLTVSWVESKAPGQPGKLRLLDQTLLPNEEVYLELSELEEIYQAIKRLSVRGAPAIGCAAALGLAAATSRVNISNPFDFIREAEEEAAYLASSRPTAVNLNWALQRCLEAIRSAAAEKNCNVPALKEILTDTAKGILEEDRELCKAIGRHGLFLFTKQNCHSILTHCNAGALATAGSGTALAPIYAARERGLKLSVFADETRPLLQGARLTVWELKKAGIDATLICDNMAGQLMKEKIIQLVLVGADRIATNGDTANKIGTYSLAVMAAWHNIPFFVAAPYSTIDTNLKTGAEIPIEHRPTNEITHLNGSRIAPENCSVHNPAFDITPASLISGIITDKGVLYPPFKFQH